jgi:Mg2+ and Co2+ transporter CorA
MVNLAISDSANEIFDSVIRQYHILDDIGQSLQNPLQEDALNSLLFKKCWIDTVQWHVEDLIRHPKIDPSKGLEYKRLIDCLNQERTDTVERIDDYYLQLFEKIKALPSASVNTESPAWAIDRLSILALKIYHMRQETLRTDIEEAKKVACAQKLNLLLEQRKDLSKSIDELLIDIVEGRKIMKVYRQMKMYNDPELNPVLYGKK